MLKIEIKLTDKYGSVRRVDVTNSPFFRCVLDEQVDENGNLISGTLIESGKIIGDIRKLKGKHPLVP